MLLFYAIWINAKVFRAFNKTLKFDLKKALDCPGKSPPKFFLKSTTSQNNSIVLMEWTNYVAEKTISKIKRMERVCHPSQSSQNPSYPSVRLSMWLSICKALRQTKDYVIFFFQSKKFIIFCYIAGTFFPTVLSLIGYFEKTWHLAIDLFTDTAAILDQLNLRSIMGCPGEHLARSDILTQYLGALFGSIFLKVFLEKNCNWKKTSTYRVWDVIMIVSFPRNILFSRKAHVNTESARWASLILLELVQYGRRMGKKVYC